jgi:hypothetical protein
MSPPRRPGINTGFAESDATGAYLPPQALPRVGLGGGRRRQARRLVAAGGTIDRTSLIGISEADVRASRVFADQAAHPADTAGA